MKSSSNVSSSEGAIVGVMLEPSLDLYGATYDTVEELLDELLTKSHARYAMIIDLKGFVLMHKKALWAPKPPSLDSLATLIASNYSANTAIAKLFGEPGFKEMVQQGEEIGTYLEELGDKAILVTIFDSSAALGRVKLFTKKTVEEVREVISNSTEEPPKLEFSANWSNESESLLEGLFGNNK